jgi:hypothetical protein
MTEDEFKIEVQKSGITGDFLIESLDVAQKLKKLFPNLTYEYLLAELIKAHNKPDEGLSFD